ncbi:hypothetical protein DYD21_18985 [Rhodohalobacter sp. SW132]|uniref:hypothetical protein n=1 Tax=Rhodohalobacter sp. SW132 TaxID=2293433 RepID=UPI000E257F80|nr:hypothetical protein [Rhodohalobacter sp. SW132]REL24294.1 hypothetical protein DYD21_18985 [Rhodohalobacter sp. SW132]
MFSTRINLFTLFAICTALFLITGCSDDSPTGADPEDAPDFPQAQPVEIDNSLFEGENVTGSEYEAFNLASSYAQSAQMNVQTSMMFGMSYFTFLQQNQAEYEDGVFNWTFSFTEGGESLTIRATAEESAGQVLWTLYMSGYWDDMEESLDEFKLLTGTVSEDGQSGQWRYYTPEYPDDPFLQYDWAVSGDDQVSFTSTIMEPEEEYQLIVDYQRDGTDNWLTYSGVDTMDDVLIFWDGSSGAGYIEQAGGERECWDETFAEASCS